MTPSWPQVATRQHSPLRLPLGTDTLAALEAKLAFVQQETAAWRTLTASIDFV